MKLINLKQLVGAACGAAGLLVAGPPGGGIASAAGITFTPPTAITGIPGLGSVPLPTSSILSALGSLTGSTTSSAAHYGFDSFGNPATYVIIGSDSKGTYVFGAPLGPRGYLAPPGPGVLVATTYGAPLVYFAAANRPAPPVQYPPQYQGGPPTGEPSTFMGPVYTPDSTSPFMASGPSTAPPIPVPVVTPQPAGGDISAAAKNAIVDIQEAWILGDPNLLRSHLDTTYSVAIYQEGKYLGAITSNEYLDRVRKAFTTESTQSFVLNERVLLPSGLVGAWGKHVYYDAANVKHVSYTCFWIAEVNGRWVVVAINEAVNSANAFVSLAPPTGSR